MHFLSQCYFSGTLQQVHTSFWISCFWGHSSLCCQLPPPSCSHFSWMTEEHSVWHWKHSPGLPSSEDALHPTDSHRYSLLYKCAKIKPMIPIAFNTFFFYENMTPKKRLEDKLQSAFPNIHELMQKTIFKVLYLLHAQTNSISSINYCSITSIKWN